VISLYFKPILAILAVLLSSWAVVTYKHTENFQMGYPGVGMELIQSKQQLAARLSDNRVPVALPQFPGGALAVDAYKNVHVLGHLPSGQFTRLMTSITTWVAPDAGCAYCHAPARDQAGNILRDARGLAVADPNKLDSDELYTKVVARRMLQMTMRINADWQAHVKETGVTCFTCHRGNPVPLNIWFDSPESATRFQGIPAPARYSPAVMAGLTSLPVGALRPYLVDEEEIRIQETHAASTERGSSIKQTEWTYALMVHMSTALGVNCTYCHNSRAFGDWGQSPPTRATAWHGVRMVRELNTEYLEPLQPILPQQRLGDLGDAPKANCTTCHQGAYKPLLGVSMLKDFPELAAAQPQPKKTAAAKKEAAPATPNPTETTAPNPAPASPTQLPAAETDPAKAEQPK
jgi:photosynthetic reaction center cytochrome c subunit